MKVFKKILKWFGLLVGLVVLVGVLFGLHTWYFKPVTIDLFFARTFLQVGLESPEMMSSIRVLEPLGIKGHNAKLDDESMAAGDRFMAKMREAHRILKTYDDEDLDEADLMSKRVALSMMDVMVEEGFRFRFHNYPVNQLFGVQTVHDVCFRSLLFDFLCHHLHIGIDVAEEVAVAGA